MKTKTHEVCLEGPFLQRGFWLYIWEVTAPEGRKLHYVGRTGDNPPCNAQSPFNRMGQHLGHAENSNMLRRYLRDKYHVAPERCRFRMVAHGPILKEATNDGMHNTRRNTIAAQEKALRNAMVESGYEVMNEVHSRKPLNRELFQKVKRAFAAKFPGLRRARKQSQRSRR